MALSYSNTLRIAEIGTGDQAGTWGVTTNYNLATLHTEAIAGVKTVAITTSTSPSDKQALSAIDGVTDEARQAVLILTGTPPVAFTLLPPPSSKVYVIRNSTSQTATIAVSNGLNLTTASGGTTVAIPAGRTTTVFCSFNGATWDAAGGFNFVPGTGSLGLPVGTTGERPTPTNGMIRYNTTLSQFEGYGNGLWGGIGGAQAGGAIMTNKNVASVSYTVASGENGLSVGPVSISSGVTITVATNQRWLIL
jgi:hypothetical protein